MRFDDPLLQRPIDWDTFIDRRLFSDGLLVMHRGRVRLETYRNGYRADDLHVVHSCSKTLTTMMVGIAVAEGRLDPVAPITRYVPALSDRPARVLSGAGDAYAGRCDAAALGAVGRVIAGR
ncbi:MAG TPA: serine hydrolase [Burkholderiaceae bacterium]|nr:serine hydrolase [Burkholderiaceae bacterium]